MGFQEVAPEGPCPYCDRPEPLVFTHSMTQYAQDPLTDLDRLLLDGEVVGEPPNPNPDLWLCVECRDEYVEYWTEMWAQYQGGLL